MTRHLASASAIAIATALGALSPAHADALLAGSISAAGGGKMGGVTVSAKADGSTITTSVYTDETGNYYFPPMPEGKYKVWAQALTFQTAQGGVVDLSKTTHKDFVLEPMKNKEDWVRQLPGDEMLAALPGDSPEDFRMKTQVRKNCTGCHSASYPLQHRFDEEGWSRILDAMKLFTVTGIYKGPDAEPSGNIQFHKKELAAYLARARGPGESSMKFKLKPRPSGEAARVVFKEYDVKLPSSHPLANDGSDWSLGTPSDSNHTAGVHDAYADFDGNIWFTYSEPSFDTTVARVDAKTGEVKPFKIDDQRGFAFGSHGITRDENGILWFNTRSSVGRGHGGLGRIDPKTQKVTVYLPPSTMSGTAGTLDADMKGNIWVTTLDGALRFNIKEEKFTEFKSVSKLPHNMAMVYGLAADKTGNGWWLLMKVDRVNYSDIATGKSGEFKEPPEAAVMENLSPEQRKMYETFIPPDYNNPYAWAQAPRRMGGDKNGDYVWIGNSFGGTMGKVNIHTKEMTLVPLPDPESQQPYQVSIDVNHNVWTNLWSTDKLAKYDSGASKWTMFDLPTRGTETRHISLLERPGQPLKVVVPYYRTRKVATMTLRSEADIAALKAQVGR